MEHQGAPARSGPVANRRTRGNAMAGAWERPNGAGGWAVVLLGLVFILIGLALAIGGIWLIALGGSWYYALAGIRLVLPGVLPALPLANASCRERVRQSVYTSLVPVSLQKPKP